MGALLTLCALGLAILALCLLAGSLHVGGPLPERQTCSERWERERGELTPHLECSAANPAAYP